MTLYEINEAMEQCIKIDPETGEILGIDEEAMEQLQMQRDQKIENAVLWVKNLTADAAAIKAEEQALAKRRTQAEKTVESLKAWLGEALQGTKFSTAKCAVSWRKSETVEADEELLPDEWMNIKVTKAPNKTAIKAALKAGADIPGCRLTEKQNIQIK